MRASCARTCVRSGSASRKTDFWTVDPRSRSPNKLYLCLYSYAEYRFPRCGGQHTDPFGFLWLYTIRFVAEFLAHARSPSDAREGRLDLKFAGAKKPYGRRRGESVKRKISLEPLFWYFVFLPISSTPGPMDFSSRIDREKAMCLS